MMNRLSLTIELVRVRAETSMVYRLILVMLAAVTEDGQYSDSGWFAAAMDISDAVIAAEGDWSARQWQDGARHLAPPPRPSRISKARTPTAPTMVLVAYPTDRKPFPVESGIWLTGDYAATS